MVKLVLLSTLKLVIKLKARHNFLNKGAFINSINSTLNISALSKYNYLRLIKWQLDKVTLIILLT